MRIGINGKFLIAKQTGVQRAAYNLIFALLNFDHKNEYFLFTCKKVNLDLKSKYPNLTIINSNLSSKSLLYSIIWEQIKLPRLAYKYNIDILHSPANIAPIFYKGKSIVHIHDLCFMINPQWYSFSFRTWYRIIIPYIVKNATIVITNSNNSRNDLIKFFNLNINKISLVHWAVDKKFLVNKPLPLTQKKDFILYVGSLEPRKNITSLINSYCLFRNKNPECKTKLLLIGGENSLFAQNHLNIKSYFNDIIVKGFVNEKELISFYKSALLVVYPSLYEGFGLPPLEAMASATPVVTSLSSSLPEVVGDAAIKVNPRNIKQMAYAIELVVKNKKLQQKLVDAGLQQVKYFTWNRVARKIYSIYYRIYNNKEISYEQWQLLSTRNNRV